MLRLAVFTLLLLSCVTADAQNPSKEIKTQENKPTSTPVETEALEVIDIPERAESQSDEEEEIHTIVERMPSFVGGDEALMQFVGRNIKYPKKARRKNIEGRVIILFVIEKDGSISNAKILRDIGGGCGKEALRVVNKMPAWNPGIQRGKVVRVKFTIPVAFSLTS